MVGWHHRLNGHGFGWTPGVGEGQGGPACCSSWGRKELDMTEQMNWTEDTYISLPRFLLWCYLILISKPPWELLILPWVSPMYMWGTHGNNLFVFHLLICLYFRLRPRTQKIEGNYISSPILWTRKRSLTYLCWHLDLELLGLQNCEQLILVYKPLVWGILLPQSKWTKASNEETFCD